MNNGYEHNVQTLKHQTHMCDAHVCGDDDDDVNDSDREYSINPKLIAKTMDYWPLLE